MITGPCEVDASAKVSEDARIFGSNRGSRIVIGPESHIFEFAVIKAVGGLGDITIGAHCNINPHCVIYCGSGVHIGNNVLVGPGTMITPANHQIESREIPIREQGFMQSRGGIIIADDVWIGANCVLLDGANVGRGAVIAAGAVVRGVIPPYTIWGGVPAKQIGVRGTPNVST